jgi:hypothetical protein
MSFPKPFFEASTDVLNGAHVDFVEGGEHGRISAGFQEAFRNSEPDAAHGLPGHARFFFRL